MELESLDKDIEAKENIIESLKSSQKIAEESSSIVDIFKNTEINEISQTMNLKTLSIKDGQRIHQFIIPENI